MTFMCNFSFLVKFLMKYTLVCTYYEYEELNNKHIKIITTIVISRLVINFYNYN